MQQTNGYWQLISHLGSSSLLMPILAIAVIGLWLSSQKKVVHLWIIGLTLAVTITVISKVFFLGWGIGIASLNFTGISGHTLLATSILPVLFFSVAGESQTKFSNIGLWFGLILSFSVGISRIVLGMHSISEVVAGWMIGLVVCGVTLNAMESHLGRLAYLQISLLFFMLAIGSTTPNYLPTHDMEIKLALLLSGHDKPYTR
jgi:membrane-associated phospholipid phosphatase